MTGRVKIIGQRRPPAVFEQAVAFLDTVVALRGDRPFIPKGYYRFKTFAEAQAWSIRMMARVKADDRRRTPDDRPDHIRDRTCLTITAKNHGRRP